jgi:hypothetical protein
MATIKISDLHSVGSELFMDSESYLNELTNDELNMAHGGWFFSPYCVIYTTVSTITITITISTIRRP